MSMTGLEMFDRTLHETNVWLKDVMERMEVDRQSAYIAMRATLHALRDRLEAGEAADLGAQMPTLVRGIYYEGWRPTGQHRMMRSGKAFIESVAEHLERSRPIDPEVAARAVFATLSAHISPGEISDVKNMLPVEIRALWP